MHGIETFDNHLNELMKNPEFKKGFEEEKERLGLAIKIAQYRQSLGLSQIELANLSGLSKQQISKIERGDNCNISTFLKVCHSLGVEINLKNAAYV
jgi:HTH-type transcriptional regulator / antitoxin HipB